MNTLISRYGTHRPGPAELRDMEMLKEYPNLKRELLKTKRILFWARIAIYSTVALATVSAWM